jgi:hypothetical protein
MQRDVPTPAVVGRAGGEIGQAAAGVEGTRALGEVGKDPSGAHSRLQGNGGIGEPGSVGGEEHPDIWQVDQRLVGRVHKDRTDDRTFAARLAWTRSSWDC